MRSTRHITRFAAALLSVAAFGATAFVPVSNGDISDQISQQQSLAKALAQTIKSDNSKIAQTSSSVATAKSQLDAVQAKLNSRLTELKRVQTELMTARDHLAQLEARLRHASDTLSNNLRAEYEQGTPNLMTVILNSHGFTDLLDQVNFAQRVSKQDAQIVAATRTARKQVLAETNRLASLEMKDRSLTNEILAQRNQQAKLETALLNQEIAETSARSGARSKLSDVNSTLDSLRNKLAKIEAAAAARARESQEQASEDVNRQAGGLAIDTAGMVQPPAGAPAAVKEMIAAGNAIATLPYIWGGGHGSFISPGYDCSGSVSYVLAAAGLLSSPEVAEDFESYGDAGAGQWVSIWAASDHVWMTIAGWRFDTVALAEYGTRWSQGGGEFAGFVERHPPGL